MFNSLATRVDHARIRCCSDDRRRTAATLLIVITADRGLCGSFNTNVIKAAAQFIAEQPRRRAATWRLALVGRKGRDFFMRRGFDVRYEEVGIFQNVKCVARAGDRADRRSRSSLGPRRRARLPRLQRVQVGRCRSGSSIERLLPIRAELEARGRGGGRRRRPIDYLFEPDAGADPRRRCCRGTSQVQVYRALLESTAAEHAAQMTAMDARDAQRDGHDRPPHALHEQGAAGGDHARDHRGRVGSAGACRRIQVRASGR